jgi:hypothetical protein
LLAFSFCTLASFLPSIFFSSHRFIFLPPRWMVWNALVLTSLSSLQHVWEEKEVALPHPLLLPLFPAPPQMYEMPTGAPIACLCAVFSPDPLHPSHTHACFSCIH